MQEGPALLPTKLTYIHSFETDKELFHALVQKPSDLVSFFQCACADETWCQEHFYLIKRLLRWMTKSYYLNRIPIYEAQQVVQTIHAHYSILKPLLFFKASLFFTMTLIVEKKEITVNSLLFGVGSHYFNDLFRIYFEKFNDPLALPTISLENFKLIETFLSYGFIDELWRKEKQEILVLMQEAKAWGIPNLVKECAEVLKRYINEQNVVDTLLKATRQRFSEWKTACQTVFNNQEWSLKILPGQELDLQVEFLDLKQETLERFKELAPFTTHLAFSHRLSEDPFFSLIVNQCPKLIGINLSGSLTYANQFDQLPSDLSEFDLSACGWLDYARVKELNMRFPRIKKLNLSNNVHLNYQTWGELNRFHQLQTLVLSRCHQINDENLKLISRGCPYLIELDLEECRGITDWGLSDVLVLCYRLEILNLSRCYTLTDKTLGEMGRKAFQLAELHLMRCAELTDNGLLELVNLRKSLQFLDIRQCSFSLQMIATIKHLFPLLEILD